MTGNHRIRINGVVPIIPTPFTDGDEIDRAELRNLIDFAHAAGCCAACLPAYASEFYKLADAERVDVVREAVQHSAGRIPIIGQVNYPSGRTAAAVAATLQEQGVDALGLTGSEVFFTDDSAGKLTGADELGMTTHLFAGVAGLRAALHDAGVRVSP